MISRATGTDFLALAAWLHRQATVAELHEEKMELELAADRIASYAGKVLSYRMRQPRLPDGALSMREDDTGGLSIPEGGG